MHLIKTLIAAALALALAPAAGAQTAGLTGIDEHANFRSELERLNRSGNFANPLVFLDFTCEADASECIPLLRVYVRNAPIANYRIPPLPPTLTLEGGRLEADKQRLKKEKKDDAVFAEACAKLPVKDTCEGIWKLKRVWKISEPPAEDVLTLTYKTQLVRPGVSGGNPQIGGRGPEQVLVIRVPTSSIPERVVVPLWEQGGVLNVPQTYSRLSGSS